MKLAIMQPYFFPYIEYWQLIQAVDTFVLFDDVQYIRHGWINRNRILNPQGGWQYIMVPLEKHGHTELIRNIVAKPVQCWREKLLNKLNHYKRKASHFGEVKEIVASILSNIDDHSICRINLVIMLGICGALGIKRRFLVSSECKFDYSQVGDAGEWALHISEQLGATEYINPISGAELFNPEKFDESRIKLTFLKSDEIVYPRCGDFEPWLSIVDVLMFNGISGTKKLLASCSLYGHPRLT